MRLLLGAAIALLSYSAECVVIGVRGSLFGAHDSVMTYVFGAVFAVSGFACLGTACLISLRSEGRPLIYRQIVGPWRALRLIFDSIRRPLSPTYLRVASGTLRWNDHAVVTTLFVLVIVAACCLIFAFAGSL